MSSALTPRLARLTAVVALLGLAGCVSDVATPTARLEPYARLQRPPGTDPVPAVMLVPDCEGVVPARVEAAADLVGRGHLVVFVDYAASRGLRTACGGEVAPADIAGDLRAVSAWLRSRSDVRAGAVAAVGWSLGGAGVLASLAGAEWAPRPPVDAAAVLYPVCRDVPPWKTVVPTLVLLAGLDEVAPPAACEALVTRAAGRVEVHTYPDARHGFDRRDLPGAGASPAFPGRTVGFQAAAARQAWEAVLAHLRTRLPSARSGYLTAPAVRPET